MEFVDDYSSRAGSPGESNRRPPGERYCWNCATDKVWQVLNYPHLKTQPSSCGVCGVSCAFMLLSGPEDNNLFFAVPKVNGKLKALKLCIHAMRHSCCMYRMRGSAYYKILASQCFFHNSCCLETLDMSRCNCSVGQWVLESMRLHEVFSEE